MRTLPAGMQAHLDGGVTTLCWCIKLTRRDGLVLGFTDHDVDVVSGGVTYEAASGFIGTAVQQELGLSVPTTDIQGALNSETLTEADLAKGLWDNAVVEIRRINWMDTSQNVIIRKGSVGEVSRSDRTFTAEFRGLAHELNQTMGRQYSYSCDATLGDSRCGVNANGGYFIGWGNVDAILSPGRWFVSNALGGFPSHWFTNGKVTWTSGNNAGATSEVRLFTLAGGNPQVELWLPPGASLTVGDAFYINAGCDKQFGTCRFKFNNAVNFRGFPYMPSNDRIVAYPDQDAVNDGGSLYGN